MRIRNLLALGLVFCGIAAACAQDGCGGDCDWYGDLDRTVIESPHPYPAPAGEDDIVWSAVVEHPGSIEMLLRFERFELAPAARLEITTIGGMRVFTASSPPGPAIRVSGDCAILELVASPRASQGDPAAAWGVRVPYVAYRIPAEIEPVPTGELELRDATCLKSGHPCSNPSWYESGRATARIFITRSSSVAQCTGTLLDREERKDVLITARHCLAGYTDLVAEFGAEYSPDCTSGSDPECRAPQTKDCTGIFYQARAIVYSPECDWGLVALDGDPGLEWGTVPMPNRDAATGTDIYVIQHPAGHCKEWDDGFISDAAASECSLAFSAVSSRGGSSGSALRRLSDNAIVGILITSGGATRVGAMRMTIDRDVLDVAYAGHPPPGINVAPRSVRVATSSVYGPGWGGDKAIDGVVSLESKWASADTGPPLWLKLDLGEEYDVSGFGVYAPSAAGESNMFDPKAFRFQSGSSWDGPWTDEFEMGIHLHRERVTWRGFPGITKKIRYVRLYLTEENHLPDDGIARIPEFEVYAVFPQADRIETW